MKILFLSHSDNNPDAGASSIYHMLNAGLTARGHHVDVLHLDDMNLPKQKLLRKIVLRLFLPQLIKRRALREDLASYDVIMASNGTAWPLFRSLKQTAHRPLLVTHFHGLSVYDQIASLTEAELGHHRVSKIFRFLTGSIPDKWDMAGIAHSDLTVVQNLRDFAHVEQKIPAGASLIVIHPAIAPSLICEAGTIAPLEARSLNKIIAFSSWGARKGSLYLPGALRKIRTRYPAVELVIGGTNMTADQLQPFFAPEDQSAIRVLGYLSREQQAQLFNDAGIFLFPSVSEGFGLALLEAQIFGLATVTTSTGYSGDFLTDNVNACIVPLTAEHFARGVLKLLEDDELRRRIAENGRKVALSFTLDVMAAAYERAFLEGLKKLKTAMVANS